MSEQSLGSEPTPPRRAANSPMDHDDEPAFNQASEATPKPPLPESTEFLVEAAEPNTVKKPNTVKSGTEAPPPPPPADSDTRRARPFAEDAV